MLSERKITRLARRARDQGPDGVLRRRAERARHTLFTAVEDGDRTAMAALAGMENVSDPVVNAVWAEWIARPGTDLWTVLDGWRQPATVEPARSLSALALETDLPTLELPAVRAALIAVAGPAGHPLAVSARTVLLDQGDQHTIDAICEAAITRRALVPFCVEHGLAPADEVRRAAFFAATGQHDQHRALDPDGSLLARAYRTADVTERDSIQQAVISDGDPDVVRVLVGAHRRDHLFPIATGETTDLAKRLADRRDYDELWRLTLDVSVTHAVGLIPLLGDWQPPGDTDRRLFHQLRAMPPEKLAVARRALTAATRADVPRRLYSGPLAVAPDRPEIALPWGSDVRVLGLPHGQTVAHHHHDHVAEVLHLGDAIIVADGHLVRHIDGRRDALDVGDEEIWLLEPIADGFVAPTDEHLLIGTALGDRIRRVPYSDLALVSRLDLASFCIGAHHASERIAVSGRSSTGDAALVVVDSAGQTLAGATLPDGHPIKWITFYGPDRLVTADRAGRLRRWRLAGDTLRLEFEARVGTIGGLLALPAHGRLVALTGSVGEEAFVAFLDPETFPSVPGPGQLAAKTAQALTGSPDNRFLALSTQRQVEVYDVEAAEIADLLHPPMADMRPRDLAAVLAADRPDRSAEAQELLGLLRACLERRFGAEVQLGTSAAAATGGPCDIGLARDGG